MQRDNIFKRDDSRYFWAIVYIDGKLCRKSTKCTDRKAAENWLRTFERANSGDTEAAKDRAPCSVDKALQLFLDRCMLPSRDNPITVATRRCYSGRANQISRLIGQYDVHSLNHAFVRTKLIEPRLNVELAARETVHKEIVTLRRALIEVKDLGLFTGMVELAVPKFKTQYTPRKNYIKPEDFKAFISHLSPKKRLWVQVAVLTGGRKTEVSSLRWEDLDFNRRRLRLRGTKTEGSDREIGMHPEVYTLLEPIRQPSGVIVGRFDNSYRELKRASERAGIPRVICHDLRRTFASWMLDGKAPTFNVAKMMGHTTSRMVEKVYGQLDQNTLDRDMSNMTTSNTFKAEPKPEPAPKLEQSRFSQLEID